VISLRITDNTSLNKNRLGSEYGLEFIINDLPSVLVLISADQMLNVSLCRSNN